MMRMIQKIRPFIFVIVIMALAAACLPTTTEPAVELTIPTAIVPVEDAASIIVAGPTPAAELPAPPTFQPTAGPTNQPAIPPTETPPSTPEFQVAFVAADDTLNVRSEPGVDNDIVGELAPDATGAQITGEGRLVDGSTWVPITVDEVTGWVNSRFLAETIDGAAFCQDEAVEQLLTELGTAIANQDDDLLAQLIHPERGLRLRHSWWNPEVRLSRAEAGQIFASAASYDWGVADGSGEPIVGPFSQEILPLLQEDLLLATETACDEILHGSTAGLVRLPDGYDPVHYYALYRPGTEEFSGLNWGTWVVGIEQWEGQYYVSFLVHFNWEI